MSDFARKSAKTLIMHQMQVRQMMAVVSGFNKEHVLFVGLVFMQLLQE